MSTAQENQASSVSQRADYLYAAIWVVFLAVPVIAVWFSTAEPEWRILSLAATAVFGAVYLWLAWRVYTSEQEATTVRLLLGCGALAVIAALSILNRAMGRCVHPVSGSSCDVHPLPTGRYPYWCAHLGGSLRDGTRAQPRPRPRGSSPDPDSGFSSLQCSDSLISTKNGTGNVPSHGVQLKSGTG